jgi:hypothetical protein
MDEQTALSIIEEMKVKFPTVYVIAVKSDKKFRDGTHVYFLGIYENKQDVLNAKSTVFSSKLDYDYFVEKLHVFRASIATFFEVEDIINNQKGTQENGVIQ